jgi:hypothetical protein
MMVAGSLYAGDPHEALTHESMNHDEWSIWNVYRLQIVGFIAFY